MKRFVKRQNLLIVADSEHDADMLYASRVFIPDPFIYLRLRGKCHLVVSESEHNRAVRQAKHCKVLSLFSYRHRLKRNHHGSSGFAEIIAAMLREKRLRSVDVPPSFPHGLAGELRRLKIRVRVRTGGIFPERQIKSADEIKKLNGALMMAEVGLAEGLHALKNSRIGRNRKLYYHNVPLTSEKLRSIINIAIIQAGGSAIHTIAAGGAQACDPHEQGHGLLRAHEPIILDVFPRSQKTGYFGDITRTVVRGRASEGVRKLYHTVARAQNTAFDQLKSNVSGKKVHQAVTEVFEREGYKTGRRNGRMQGFFHGTGHGVGLQIHETPRIAENSSDILRSGHVVTVEPGLYYPGLGAVRLEDTAQITRHSARNLTKFEKMLEV